MVDLATISGALSGIKTATEIAAFLRNCDLNLEKAEAKNKLADLMSALAEVKMEVAGHNQVILDQKERIRSLEAELEEKGAEVWTPPYYWLERNGKKEGPYCQQCRDNERKWIRLQTTGNGWWTCKACENGYEDKSYARAHMRVAEHEYDPFA